MRLAETETGRKRRPAKVYGAFVALAWVLRRCPQNIAHAELARRVGYSRQQTYRALELMRELVADGRIEDPRRESNAATCRR